MFQIVNQSIIFDLLFDKFTLKLPLFKVEHLLDRIALTNKQEYKYKGYLI